MTGLCWAQSEQGAFCQCPAFAPASDAPAPPRADETDPRFVLHFCRAAIEDAIALEDGLDGETGRRVLTMIDTALAASPAQEATPPRGNFYDAMREQSEEERADAHFGLSDPNWPPTGGAR